MADVILNQTDVQVKAILDRMQAYVAAGNNGAVLGFGYGECSTAGGTQVKEVSIPDFVLCPNAVVSVLFREGFTISNPQLKIGSNSAYPITFIGDSVAPGKVRDFTIVTMIYKSSGFFEVISFQYMVAVNLNGAVDLALPSGLLWCEHNIGASRPEDPGLYFSWGNPTGHAEGSGYNFDQTTYDATGGAALTGDIPVSDTYDMAHHNMGGDWRLPRPSEFSELNSYCDHEWIDQDGVNGMRFTSRNNGASIFFPAAGIYDGTTLGYRGSYGFYWSSGFSSASNAYYLYFHSSNISPQDYSSRRLGFTVRAVM